MYNFTKCNTSKLALVVNIVNIVNKPCCQPSLPAIWHGLARHGLARQPCHAMPYGWLAGWQALVIVIEGGCRAMTSSSIPLIILKMHAQAIHKAGLTDTSTIGRS